MTRKIYKRIGLRRDKNFGDLSDARSALNNLLDGLVTDGGDTFISEDLEPIRNRYNDLVNDRNKINDLLSDGASKARAIAKDKISEIREVIGIKPIS